MSSAVVRSAFHTALGQVLPVSTPLLDIDTLEVTPPLDANGLPTLFAGLLYFATEDMVTVGSPGNELWREQGTVDVLIYQPAGRGSASGVSLADTVRRALGGRDLPVSSPGRRLTVLRADPLSGYLARAGQPTGAYVVGMVGLSYQLDFIR